MIWYENTVGFFKNMKMVNLALDLENPKINDDLKTHIVNFAILGKIESHHQ